MSEGRQEKVQVGLNLAVELRPIGGCTVRETSFCSHTSRGEALDATCVAQKLALDNAALAYRTMTIACLRGSLNSFSSRKEDTTGFTANMHCTLSLHLQYHRHKTVLRI